MQVLLHYVSFSSNVLSGQHDPHALIGLRYEVAAGPWACRHGFVYSGKSMRLPFPELEELLSASDSIQEVPERSEKLEAMSNFGEAFRIKKAKTLEVIIFVFLVFQIHG